MTFEVKNVRYCCRTSHYKDRFRLLEEGNEEEYKKLGEIIKKLKEKYTYLPINFSNFLRDVDSIELDISHATRLVKLSNGEKGNLYDIKFHFEKMKTLKDPNKTYIVLVPEMIKLTKKFQVKKGEVMEF